MRCLTVILCFLLCSSLSFGQGNPLVQKGKVSYVSSQHIYVKFPSTEQIEIKDTLYSQRGEKLVPTLIVENKSSISCVCRSLIAEKFQVDDEVYSRQEVSPPPAPPPPLADSLATSVVKPPEEDQQAPLLELEEENYEQKIRGRISVGSYSNFSEHNTRHRMRYTFSFQGNHLKDSRFSVNSYISFRHTLNEWEAVKSDFGRALKVYAFSIKYDIDRLSSLSLGRRINPRISSMGAIDGAQYERALGTFTLGVIAGFRPNLRDYGLDLKMFQTGAYLTHVSKSKKAYEQSTFGVIEQRNHAKIDRRFLYIQHSSTPLKDLNLFASMELDLYKNFNETPSNTLSLTNLFVSMRYRVSRKLSGTISYDNRKNIIYYESYKNYIDSLIENETRQGLRLGIMARPFKYVTVGAGVSLRFQPGEKNASRNLNTYINYSKVPFLNMSASLNINFLETTYLRSSIYGLRLSRDIISGKLNGDMYLRMVHYKYTNYEYDTQQYLGGIGLNYRLSRKLGFYIYYEGTIDQRTGMYNRFNTKIIKRF